MKCNKCGHEPRLYFDDETPANSEHCYCDCHYCKTCHHHEGGHNEDGVCRIDNTHFDYYDDEHPYDCQCMELRL